MTDSSTSNHETFSYTMIDQIDQICDQFEQDHLQKCQPRIEDYLARVDASVRNRLLRDLVAVDYEYTQRVRVIDFSEYFDRFPDALTVLQVLQDELELSERERQMTPNAVDTGDVTIQTSSDPKPFLKNFRLMSVAGRGGFGTVWRAMDLRLQREVAVKIPRPDKADRIHLSELTREAQTAAKLKHPNIVSVHEVGEENGVSFIVTDYIDGVDLREWRRSHKILPNDAARLIAKLAVALQHAHDNGIIHRDLKSSNVLMNKKGEPHVADFGLAKREAHDDSLAIRGQVQGTPAYMAPEQARADHDAVDRRTDVYSLGVILYELMTGTTPFRGELPDLLQQILDQPPVPPRVINPDIPRELQAICLKCLAKDTAKRYLTAQALADDLQLFLNGETLRGIPAVMPDRIWKWIRRNRRSITTTATIAMLVALGSIAWMTYVYPRAKPSAQLREVEFTTEPKGCEITVVAIDEQTGEPDPTHIQTAKGKTPLTMWLEGGDYLVVAVHEPDGRFHEVYRHVPRPDEARSYGYIQSFWKLKYRSNVVEFKRPIMLPRLDISVQMAFCDGADHLDEPPLSSGENKKIWKIPAFYVDRSEISIAELNERNIPDARIRQAGSGPSAIQRHFECIELMEEFGKRLPSAAEQYYLRTRFCPDSTFNDFDHDAPVILPDNTVINGLSAGLWEWTSTKPGGPFSGCVSVPKELGIDAESRMVGCGKHVPDDDQTGYSSTGCLASPERQLDAGFRGVRSVKPRRTQQDFIVRINSAAAH